MSELKDPRPDQVTIGMRGKLLNMRELLPQQSGVFYAFMDSVAEGLPEGSEIAEEHYAEYIAQAIDNYTHLAVYKAQDARSGQVDSETVAAQAISDLLTNLLKRLEPRVRTILFPKS